jgi:hypothetical protein
MNKMWMAVPSKIRVYLEALASMWLSVVGLAAVTWGVCLFLLPLGVIVGGFCALLLDRAIDMTLTRGGHR